MFPHVDTVYKQLAGGNDNLSLEALVRGLAGIGLELTPSQARAFQKDLDLDDDGVWARPANFPHALRVA